MIILLGSKNPSKENALKIVLENYNITDYKIISYDVNSGVSSKPIGKDIVDGVDNRNKELKK